MAVCVECDANACTLQTYLGRGRYNRSRSVAGIDTWHGNAQPVGVDFIDDVPCEPALDLGRDYAVLPVTHTRAGGTSRGSVWLYYARGCSDLGWGVGRTLLAKNREDAAIRLVQRLHGGNRASSASRVAELAWRRFPLWAAKVVRAANTSYSRFTARLRSRSLEALLLDAAGGIVQEPGDARSGCHIAGTVVGARACAGRCALRARALLYLFGSLGDEGKAMDALNAELLSALCRGPRPLDSVVLYQQPHGSHGRWATEIWDATALCVARGVGIPRGPSGEAVGGPLWLNGSQCVRSPPDEYRRCYACAGSRLQRACAVKDWRQPRRRTRARVAQPR